MNTSGGNLRRTEQSPVLRSTEEDGGMQYDSNFSRIEELIKRNTFSREEISHLMEVLNSRVENVGDKQISSSNAGGDTQLVSWTNEIQRTPSQEKPEDIHRTMVDSFREKPDKIVQIPVGVSASPIDIARAYMAGRTSEGGQDLYNPTSKRERAQTSYEFARKPLLPSASPKPSICWPGSMAHERHSYATPQSQRTRHSLHDFPRTPYSRTVLSKSTTKFQTDSEYANTSTPIQGSSTSTYGQVKSRGETADVYGSVGPIRRIRNRFASEVRPRGSILMSSRNESPKMATPKVFGGFLPSSEKNLELGETSGTPKYWSGDNVLDSSDRAISNSDISSSQSQAVKKILEHLDRNKPNPKEKEAETKLATPWRSSTDATKTIHEENIGGVASHKSKFLPNFHEKSMDEAKDAVNENSKASSSFFAGSSIAPGAKATSIFGLKGTTGLVENKSNETSTNMNFFRSQTINGQDSKIVAGTTSQDFPKSHGNNKPLLKSISVNKAFLQSVPSENGPSFTFPVSASAGGGFAEPPTPSITPSSSQPIGGAGPTVPSYTFATEKSTPRLVFSFPSTSNASAQNDGSDIKFNFGSDKKTRLSFSSFGKDEICY
ncbi:hypothetical protein ABFS82_11G044400 [Erythranthe guttata]